MFFEEHPPLSFQGCRSESGFSDPGCGLFHLLSLQEARCLAALSEQMSGLLTCTPQLLPSWSSLSQLRVPLTLNHPTSSSHHLNLIIKNKIKKSYSYNCTCKIVFLPLSCHACCSPGLYIIILAPRNPVFLQSNLRASSLLHLLAMITLSSAWGPLVTWRSHYGKA